MSHTLTEVATFDATIVVPDGGDSGANRAGDVELIAQRLANRSRALKAVTDNAAVKNASNTFTQPNTFSALTTMQTLHVNSTTEVAGNLWVDSGHDVLYMGSVVTLHKHISLARGSGNVAAANNVRMQLASPILENFAAAQDGVWFVPIELPSGCQLVDAEFQYNGGPSGGAFSFTIVRQTISDWAATPVGTPTYTAIGAGTVGSSAGVHTASIALANYAINNLNESYYARILFNDGFDNGTVWGFRLGFTNYGLNNR
jgi:hypothetical protein